MTRRPTPLAMRLEALQALAPLGRGARFARRVAGKPPVGLSELHRLPGWTTLPPERHDIVAMIAGLLAHRGAIDRELSGSRLRALAESVGTGVFDAVCEAAVDGGSGEEPLPDTDRIAADGHAMLDASLPAAIRRPGVAPDPRATEIAATALNVLESAAP